MKKEIQVASAFSLILSLGCVAPLGSGLLGANRPLGENCRQFSKTAGSLVTSVPEILCDQERENELAFSSFINSERLSTPVQDPKLLPLENDQARATTNNGSSTMERRPKRHQPPTVAVIRLGAEDFFVGRDLDELSPAERKKLRRNLEALLPRFEVIAFLNSIQWGEAGGPIEIVGGTSGKSLKCRRLIAKLDLSGHPKEQGLPNQCFFTSRKYGLSTAAGLYQIVYYRNWRSLRQLLGLKDFSEKSQAIAALEIMRSSAAKGSKVGDGFVALLKGDLDGAIRRGTDPWASSPYSRWKGKYPVPLLQYARQELKTLRRHNTYALREVRRFSRYIS